MRWRNASPTNDDVAKRMLLHFDRGAYPAYERADEQGMPQPCVLGIPWVNDDTLRTLAKLRIPRTDPWGRPLPVPAPRTKIPGSR